MLEVKDVSIGYKGRTVLSDLSFEVAQGECVLLRGSNGSGKTTLLRTIAGLQKPISGTIRVGKTVLVPTRIPKVKGFTVRELLRAISRRGKAVLFSSHDVYDAERICDRVIRL